ncbi:clindamycin resistance transfer factor BtgA [Bacteroidia bacterium]|nr:clindamycin resistance transfer factor BtgA [Bacteroidia bacterium]
MGKVDRKTVFTTVAIDGETNRLIEKVCKRYSLKKNEVVKSAFVHMDKASINPAEAPESVKSELSKINKRQDDIIRFIRNYEEKELNPMIRTSHSIAVKFDGVAKALEKLILSHFEDSRDKQQALLQKLSEVLTNHADVINNQGKQINSLSQIQQKDNKKLLKLVSLYSELATCGMMDSKRKENLKSEIIDLISE